MLLNTHNKTFIVPRSITAPIPSTRMNRLKSGLIRIGRPLCNVLVSWVISVLNKKIGSARQKQPCQIGEHETKRQEESYGIDMKVTGGVSRCQNDPSQRNRD